MYRFFKTQNTADPVYNLTGMAQEGKGMGRGGENKKFQEPDLMFFLGVPIPQVMRKSGKEHDRSGFSFSHSP